MHFAIDDETARRLLAAAGDDRAVRELVEWIEFEGGGDECPAGAGWEDADELTGVVSSGRRLYRGHDCVVSYLAPQQVCELAKTVPEPGLREFFARSAAAGSHVVFTADQ